MLLYEVTKVVYECQRIHGLAYCYPARRCGQHTHTHTHTHMHILTRVLNMSLSVALPCDRSMVGRLRKAIVPVAVLAVTVTGCTGIGTSSRVNVPL